MVTLVYRFVVRDVRVPQLSKNILWKNLYIGHNLFTFIQKKNEESFITLSSLT